MAALHADTSTLPNRADDSAQEASLSATLPGYVRSMLRIRVTLSVELAATKQPVSRILELGPGSIIAFHKHCEQPMTMRIGSQRVAMGEAVKVGDKFGIRVTSLATPDERFVPLQGRS